jgi:hypothetical protein
MSPAPTSGVFVFETPGLGAAVPASDPWPAAEVGSTGETGFNRPAGAGAGVRVFFGARGRARWVVRFVAFATVGFRRVTAALGVG